MIDKVLADAEAADGRSVADLQPALDAIQLPRLQPAMFDKVLVDYYGAPTPVPKLATLSFPEPRLAVIAPFDRALLAAIVKAVTAANLGVTVNSDGSVVRAVLPATTPEQQNAKIKQAQQAADSTRVTIRNTHRRAGESLDKEVTSGTATQDDVRRAKVTLDQITQRYLARVDELLKRKTAELNAA